MGLLARSTDMVTLEIRIEYSNMSLTRMQLSISDIVSLCGSLTVGSCSPIKNRLQEIAYKQSTYLDIGIHITIQNRNPCVRHEQGIHTDIQNSDITRNYTSQYTVYNNTTLYKTA